jgi:hypothetical protein
LGRAIAKNLEAAIFSMLRAKRLHPIDLALRLLLVAACVWPVTGARQLATSLGFAQPPAFAGQAPVAPVNEEEENERTVDAKSRAGQRTEYRPDPPRVAPRISSPSSQTLSARRLNATTFPPPADPFCNGLGTPYRC